MDFLERASEPSSSAEVSIVDEATAIAAVEPEVKVDTLIVHTEVKSKVKPKTLPKVPL